jgi:hypothetical protein
MCSQDLWQSVKRDAARQVMDMVDADIPGEPSQQERKLIVGAAVKRRLVKAPVRLGILNSMLELMLDVEQPYPGRRGNQGDRHMDSDELHKSYLPDNQCGNGDYRRVGPQSRTQIEPE